MMNLSVNETMQFQNPCEYENMQFQTQSLSCITYNESNDLVGIPGISEQSVGWLNAQYLPTPATNRTLPTPISRSGLFNSFATASSMSVFGHWIRCSSCDAAVCRIKAIALFTKNTFCTFLYKYTIIYLWSLTMHTKYKSQPRIKPHVLWDCTLINIHYLWYKGCIKHYWLNATIDQNLNYMYMLFENFSEMTIHAIGVRFLAKNKIHLLFAQNMAFSSEFLSGYFRICITNGRIDNTLITNIKMCMLFWHKSRRKLPCKM